MEKAEISDPKVFVNRTLNMKKIRFIGLDMDHTLVRYKTKAFDELTHRTLIKKLVVQKGYPELLYELRPDFDLVIRGLVIDRKKGNLLKVNRYGWIRKSSHGSAMIDFASQGLIYKSVYIDLSETDKYHVIDTAFTIPTATLFAQLIDLKDRTASQQLPNYETLCNDLLAMEDEAHNDDSLKGEVAKDLEKYIARDEATVKGLERYIKHGKKIFLITNSDIKYTQLLLDYALNPFLKDFRCWQDLFELVITDAQKPRFFYEKQPYFAVHPDGSHTPFEGKLGRGIYKGGNAMQFTVDFGLEGEEILYIGDHIYSDILRLKKSSNWRTALVLDELEAEVESYKRAEPFSEEIHALMNEKEPLEKILIDLVSAKIEGSNSVDENRILSLGLRIHTLDGQIGYLISQGETLFNARWGEIMRAGNEESYLAYQIDRFACIYMAKLVDLLEQSPRNYYRAIRRPLAHELALTM